MSVECVDTLFFFLYIGVKSVGQREECVQPEMCTLSEALCYETISTILYKSVSAEL